ncbi:MAG: glutamate--tRNA ligase [Pseudomonadota bacterium]
MSVRTRIAPSPTGDPHLGTAYIALFNMVFARSQGGEFILRIEDTDRERSHSQSEAMIFAAMRWLGIDWAEGPDVGGPHAPYRQSERGDIYRQHVERLIEQGDAFYCFCTPERLDAMRAEQRAAGQTTRYDGRCAGVELDVARRRVAAGEPHVVRLRVPSDGTFAFDDALRGRIEIPWDQVDMQVLQKSDGMPTYHLAVVVDDHLMEISHVLRGEEWINSMPKHARLYEAFGWSMPVHAHLPLLRNPDQSKLSKRKNPTSVNFYRDMGYLPQALTNYLGRMGWSMPDERELFSLGEMIEAFDLGRVSLGGPIFDIEKLNWLNGEYLRRLDPADFATQLLDWLASNERLNQIVPLIQQRTERFADIAPQVDYLIGERKDLDSEDFAHLKLDEAQARQILDHVGRSFDELRDWHRDALYEICNHLAGALNMKLREFLGPLFVAIGGKPVTLPLFDSMALLGSDLTRARLRSALAALGGVSKKEAKRFEKSWRQTQG